MMKIKDIASETGVPEEKIFELIQNEPKLKDVKNVVAAGGKFVLLSDYEEKILKEALKPES